MPRCDRCERVLATGELRRRPMSTGFLCKDGDKWSRCAAIAKQLRTDARSAARSAAA